ncbi:MAG: hypothetical protein RRX93_03445 [Bacteroidales bacterium]
MKKILISIILFLSGILCLNAQVKQIYSIHWDMSTPIGKYRTFTNEYSCRGFSVNAHIFPLKHLSIGIQIGWHSFHKNVAVSTFRPSEGTAFTAATYNYVEDIPLAVGAYYHFLPDFPFAKPYIGLGIGAVYCNNEIQFQDLTLKDPTWGFALIPEIGVFIPFGSSPVGLNVFAKYGVGFNNYAYRGESIQPYQYLNIGIGLSFYVN